MRYQKGTTGNPNGRPRGRTAGAKIRAAIEQHSEAILTTVIRAATNGDMQAARMLLDRITPPLKAQAVPIALAHRESLSDQSAEVVKAIMAGTISPDIGSQLIAALGAQAKIVEVDEMMKRIQALEARFNEPS